MIDVSDQGEGEAFWVGRGTKEGKEIPMNQSHPTIGP